jgi:hypothetical protein
MSKRLVAGTNAVTLQPDGKLRVESLDASEGVYTDANKDLTSTPPTSGTLGYWARTGTELTTATGGDTVDMNYQGLQHIYQQMVTVAKAGGDFATIQGAIDYAVTQVPSTTNRFCVLIHPGDYAETIVGADYVELMGLAAREAANITGATGPLYTFPDNEGHIFNLKFTLSPTTDAQVIVDVPATVSARQVISNCLFTVTSASDVATYVFDIKAGEIECINNRVIFSNTNTAAGAVRSQRIWNVTGNAIVDLYGNIVDVDIYDVNDRVFVFIDDSLTGGEIHIKENVIRVDSHNVGAYSGAIGFIVYVGATATLHVAHNFVELTSAETAGTGVGTFARSNSAGSGLIRATANHVIVQGFASNYWASVAAGDTIVSHFDNVVAVDGSTGGGTITYVNSQADGELDVSGAARFEGPLTLTNTARIDWGKYTADNLTLNNGTSADGVADLQTLGDGNFYHITEAAGAPGIDLEVEFVSVTAFDWVQIKAVYDGATNHAVGIQLYNFNTTTWDTFNAAQTSQEDVTNAGEYILNSYDFFVPDDANYIGTGADDGDVRVRFHHTMAGNVSHDLYIDVVALYQ